MAVIQDPTDATKIARVSPELEALSVVNKPIDPGALGAYMVSVASGTMAAGMAGGSEVVQFRYGGANLCLVEQVMFEGMTSLGTGFTAGVASALLTITRNYTANGSGGGAATLTGNNQKLKTSVYGTTGLSEIRVATTAGLTSPAGDAPDANPIARAQWGVSTATNAQQAGQFLLFDAYGVGHPIELAQNEGLILSMTVPATGTWAFSVRFKWTEILAATWRP
jgi:hypothetical protein